MKMKALVLAAALALTASPTLAATTCPATFEAFLRKFTEDRLFQFNATAARIDDSHVEDGDPEPVSVKMNISKNNLIYPIIESSAERKRLGLDLEISDAAGPRPEVKVQKADTDWVVLYKFEKRACWVLVARENWSL